MYLEPMAFSFLRFYLFFSTFFLGSRTPLWFVPRLSLLPLLLPVSPFSWLSGAAFTILPFCISRSVLSKWLFRDVVSQSERAGPHCQRNSLRPDPGGVRLQSFIWKRRCQQSERSSLELFTLKWLFCYILIEHPRSHSLSISLRAFFVALFAFTVGELWLSGKGEAASCSQWLEKFTENTWPWSIKM